ncbi:MAG TPA: Ig-like domain-containing protein [Allosphingosinicella sp.]|jgi:VCBS repeat-containing protein
MAIFKGTKHAETLNGGAGDDFIFGDNGNDILNGNAGNDTIDGGNGSDTLRGGAGNDELDGGNGQDTAVYAGRRSDYHLTQRADGSVIVRDLRQGAADGTDRLVSIERVQFADGTFKTVDLISTNAAPIAVNDALTLAEDAGATNVASILLANDSDADGDALAITAVQAVSDKGAKVAIGPNGTVTYDAGQIFADLDAGETATDTFTYTITDAQGLTSTATATVTITGVTQNEAPIAADDALTLAENAGATDVTSTLLANDTDADGDAFAISAVQAVSDKGAVVTVGPDGKVIYDAGLIFADLGAGETAIDKFTYTITDALGATSTATATVTITGVSQNSAPVAVNDLFALAEDAGKTELTPLVLANDTDADGDALKVVSVQAVSARGAALTVDADGKLLYDAGAIFSDLKTGQVATDSFTYTVTDPSGATSTATATLKIQGTTQAPDFLFYVQEDGEKQGMMSILQNYFNMNIESVEGPAMGGTIKFDDVAGILSFSADHDSFDRLLPDQKMESFFTVVGAQGEKKLIGMVIHGINDQIVAGDDALAVGEGATTGNLWTALISNDHDIESSVASRRIVSLDTTGTLGTLVMDTFKQSLTYSAANIDLAPGETRTDTFSYTVTDGWGSSDTATVTVTVTGEGASVSMAQGDSAVSLAAFAPEGDAAAFADFGAVTAMQPEILGADVAHMV